MFDAGGRAEAVGWRVFHVVEEAGDVARGDVQAGIGRSVIYQHRAVCARNPAVAEDDVRHIADAFAAFGRDKIPAGLGDNARRIVGRCEEKVEHVAESCGSVSDSVGQVQPTLGRLDRCGALPVLELRDRVINAAVDDRLGPGHWILH